MTTDLSKFYRVPKISIDLPSGQDFYPDDFMTFNIDGTVSVCQMTAKDELMLKMPDALLNGESIAHVIASCVPGIKDVRQLLAPDVEALLLGVFYASFGPNLDFKHTCPNEKCKHENEFEIPIRKILDSCKSFTYPMVITSDLGIIESKPTKILSYIKPYTYETSMKLQLLLFKHHKMMQNLLNDDNSDDAKIKFANDFIQMMASAKFDNVIECVDKIEIHEMVNSEWEIQIIDNKEEIKGFVFNADRDMIDPIVEGIDELNKCGVDKKLNAKCVKCGHEWATEIEFNPSSFFEKSSKRSNQRKSATI